MSPRPSRVTALLCTAQFMVVLDVTIVAIALPRVQRELGFSVTGLQWVISAYTLAFGGLLLLAGRAGDLYGHRRLLVAGLGTFGLSSLACGLAWSAAALVAARVVQGVGAALVAPSALSLLSAAFPEGARRRRAVAWWTAAAAGGGAGGWVLGGVLADGPGWRWVFLVNVPIAAVAAVVAPRLLAETPRDGDRRLDVPGGLTVTAGTALLIYGLQGAAAIALPAAATLLAAFVVIERRSSRPLVPGLRRPLVVPVLAAAALTATTTPAMFFSILYQQQVLGVGVLETGLRCAPFNLVVIAGASYGPRLTARAGTARTMGVGLLLVAAGAAVLLRTGRADAYATTFLPGFVLMGTGLGVASVASTTAGTAAAGREGQGLASGLLGAAAQLGSVLGLASLVAVATTRTGTLTGYHWAFAGAALTALVAAPLVSRRGRTGAAPHRTRTAATRPAEDRSVR